jgi:hypothetical protein
MHMQVSAYAHIHMQNVAIKILQVSNMITVVKHSCVMFTDMNENHDQQHAIEHCFGLKHRTLFFK